MSFLKKLGKILSTGLQIVSGVGPLLAPKQTDVFGKITNVLTHVQRIVIDTEVLGNTLGLTGAQKLDAATAASIQLFLDSSLLVNRKVADEVAFRAAVRKIVEGTVDMLNAIKDDGIETENKL